MTETAEAPATEATPEATEATTEATPSAAEQAVADAVAETKDAETGGEAFEHVLDKYKKEGRSMEDSNTEQAKAYKELQSKFGSFTGAPDDYAVELSDGLKDSINLDDFADDPILSDAKDMAKEMGMSNEGFNKFIELYFRGQLADVEAVNQVREEEMQALGKNADRRLSNIQDYAKTHLDADTAAALENTLTSGSAVAAIESLIALTRNSPQVQDVSPAPSISHADLQEKLLAKDEFGQRKMNDPAYAREVRKGYGQAFGAEPHNVIVGKR